MQTILTRNEILEYSRQGVKVIKVAEMPLMTDLAREELSRLGMDIVVSAEVGQSASSPVQSSVGQASASTQPKVSGVYGGGTVHTGSAKPYFKDVIRGNKPLTGTFIGTPHPVITEYVGHLGFDFVCIDSEHNAMTLETVQRMLQSMSRTPTYGMVRVPTNTYECVSGALDIGADALLIPQIRTADDIVRLKAYSQYPPIGRRGAGPSRLWEYGDTIGTLGAGGDKNYTTNIVVQLETVSAVEHLDEILAVSDFIDMFFIGPGDLSMDMGIFGQSTNPKLVEAIEMMREKTRRAGKKLGIFAGNFEAAANWYKKGFDMTIINSELGLLGTSISRDMKGLKESIGVTA